MEYLQFSLIYRCVCAMDGSSAMWEGILPLALPLPLPTTLVLLRNENVLYFKGKFRLGWLEVAMEKRNG